MEECISQDGSIVEPLTGCSSTGELEWDSAGGPIDCRGYPEELTATLLRGASAGTGSQDATRVNRLTVGPGLTSLGFPHHEDVCHPFDMELIIALVNKAAGPQLDDAVPSLSSVSRDRETTRKVGDRRVLFEPLDFRPDGTGLQCKLSPPDARGDSFSSPKASGAFDTSSRSPTPFHDLQASISTCGGFRVVTPGLELDDPTFNMAIPAVQDSMLAEFSRPTGCGTREASECVQRDAACLKTSQAAEAVDSSTQTSQGIISMDGSKTAASKGPILAQKWPFAAIQSRQPGACLGGRYVSRMRGGGGDEPANSPTCEAQDCNSSLNSAQSRQLLLPQRMMTKLSARSLPSRLFRTRSRVTPEQATVHSTIAGDLATALKLTQSDEGARAECLAIRLEAATVRIQSVARARLVRTSVRYMSNETTSSFELLPKLETDHPQVSETPQAVDGGGGHPSTDVMSLGGGLDASPHATHQDFRETRDSLPALHSEVQRTQARLDQIQSSIGHQAANTKKELQASIDALATKSKNELNSAVLELRSTADRTMALMEARANATEKKMESSFEAVSDVLRALTAKMDALQASFDARPGNGNELDDSVRFRPLLGTPHAPQPAEGAAVGSKSPSSGVNAKGSGNDTQANGSGGRNGAASTVTQRVARKDEPGGHYDWSTSARVRGFGGDFGGPYVPPHLRVVRKDEPGGHYDRSTSARVRGFGGGFGGQYDYSTRESDFGRDMTVLGNKDFHPDSA